MEVKKERWLNYKQISDKFMPEVYKILISLLKGKTPESTPTQMPSTETEGLVFTRSILHFDINKNLLFKYGNR